MYYSKCIIREYNAKLNSTKINDERHLTIVVYSHAAALVPIFPGLCTSKVNNVLHTFSYSKRDCVGSIPLMNFVYLLSIFF